MDITSKSNQPSPPGKPRSRRAWIAAAVSAFVVAAVTVGYFAIHRNGGEVRTEAAPQAQIALAPVSTLSLSDIQSITAKKEITPEQQKSLEQELQVSEELARTQPKNEEIRAKVGYVRVALAQSHLSSGDRIRAEETYRAAIPVWQAMIAEFPSVGAYQVQLAMTYQRVGDLGVAQGKCTEAMEAYRLGLPILEKLAQQTPTDNATTGDTARGSANSTAQLGTRKATQESGPAMRQAVPATESPATPTADVSEYQQLLADSYLKYAGLQAKLKQRADAEATAQKAIAVAERLATGSSTDPRYSPLLASALCQWGDCQLEREPRVALERYERAVQTLEPIHAKDPNSVREALRQAYEVRAQAKLRLKRLFDGRADWARAVALEPETTRVAQLARWCLALAQAGYVTEAILAVEPLIDGPQANSQTLYNAARVYVHVSLITNDADTDYLSRALELLQQAVAKGFDNVEYVKTDEDIAPLRQLDGYRRLILQMEAKRDASTSKNDAKP